MGLLDDVINILKNPFRNPFGGIGAPSVPGPALPPPGPQTRKQDQDIAPITPPRPPQERVGLPGNTKIFKLPDGSWVTIDNSADVLRMLRASGYRGMWFPTGAGLTDFIQNRSGEIKVYRAFNEWWNDTGRNPQADPTLPPGPPGGGSGFGSIGPIYQAPDEGAVKEALQGFQVAVTGQLEEELLDSAVAEYLEVHKKDFDDTGGQHDPFLAAKVIIRGSASYKDIHELRPESENELAWVTTQQGRLRTLGLTSDQSEQLGIKLARVGANQTAAQEAGEKSFLFSTGRVHKDQRDSLKSTARQVLGLL